MTDPVDTKHSKLGQLLRCAIWFFALVPVAQGKPESQELDPGLLAFVAEHCIDCHGADVEKAGLNLERLSAGLGDSDEAKTWAEVLDKVRDGKMPPAKKPQPSKETAQAFTEGLSKVLHDASFASQQRQGRSILRRLNRNEYEATLRDLLGRQVEVKELLPEDGTAAGFDNVGAALDISAIHLLRYQQAAERAVRSVIPSHQAEGIKVRNSGRQITEKTKTFASYLDKSMRLDGDRLILYVRTYASVPCSSERVREPGRYRVTAALSTVGTGGRALPVMVTHGGYQTSEKLSYRRVHDIPAKGTTIISEEFDLERNEIVTLNPWDLPIHRDLIKQKDASPLKTYRGAGLVVDWIEIEGPLDPFPSAGYRRLFGDVPLKRKVAHNPRSLHSDSENPREDAQRLIQAFLPLAFRRPVTAPQTAYFTDLALRQLDEGKSFQEAMVMAYTAALCSPYFLYLTETLSGDEPGKRTLLDHYAVASRLSYFLWSSMPDEELFKLARAGQLHQPKVLHSQVERMLDDPKSEKFRQNFTGQWLDLRSIDATTPDPRVYAEFDDFLFWSMPRETEAFFAEVLSEDLPVSEFVHSDWTFLNQRLAQHYGIDGISGGQLRRVSLPPGCHRGGVLTHASIMKVTADGSRTSPVLRGKWVLERLLGMPPDPPPPNTPAIDPDVRGTTTIREQLDRHRNIDACAACHKHIDPPGFALESFDAIGGWRDFYRGSRQTRVELANYPGHTVARGANVDASGQVPDGHTFRDIDGYKQILLADEDQIARNLTEKLIIYATGTDLQFADRQVVEELVDASRNGGHRLRTILHAVVQSRVFLNK